MTGYIACLLSAILLLGCVPAAPTPSPTPDPSPTMAAMSQEPEPSAVIGSSNEMADENAFQEARLDMVSLDIERRGVTEPAVLQAMRNVPRHRFVPDFYLDQAYDDHPLPIGFGQTISQPYIVALMTAALQVESGERVLEVGTGSGYQAAVLAEMGVEVYTIEIIPELAEKSSNLLERLGYENARVLQSDGYFGWPEFSPFDAIIVTAAPDHLPQPLADQLAEGGRLVIPIGPVGAVQTLWLFQKEQGELSATNLGAVRFVPFTRQP